MQDTEKNRHSLKSHRGTPVWQPPSNRQKSPRRCKLLQPALAGVRPKPMQRQPIIRHRRRNERAGHRVFQIDHPTSFPLSPARGSRRLANGGWRPTCDPTPVVLMRGCFSAVKSRQAGRKRGPGSSCRSLSKFSRSIPARVRSRYAAIAENSTRFPRYPEPFLQHDGAGWPWVCR